MSVKRDLQNASAWEAELNKERAGALTRASIAKRPLWALARGKHQVHAGGSGALRPLRAKAAGVRR